MRLLLAAVLGLAACARPDPPAAGPFVTDRAVYTARYLDGSPPYARYGFTLVARFRNETDAPVYLGRCDPDSPTPLYGVVAADASAAGTYSPVWACVGHDRAFRVEPGETRTDTLGLSGPNGWSAGEEPDGELAGRFRLAYSVRSCPEDSAECGILNPPVLSAPFRVRTWAFDRLRARVLPRR